jgi:hypothetical protein
MATKISTDELQQMLIAKSKDQSPIPGYSSSTSSSSNSMGIY